MPNATPHFPRRSIFRRLWKPMVAAGTGSTAVAVWFEELVTVGQEILAILFLPMMAGTIYLLDMFIFKSRMPRRGDLENANDKKPRK